jgi:hypothetical protein
LKYSVKRIEEIVYDLSIRKLLNQKPDEGMEAAAAGAPMKED